MNDTIFIAQNEIINLCQGLQKQFGLTYKEIIFALGFAEGRIAQMDYTNSTYTLITEAAKERKDNEVTSDNEETNQN